MLLISENFSFEKLKCSEKKGANESLYLLFPESTEKKRHG